MDMKDKMKPPATSQDRKETPVFSGFDRYFPAAKMLISRLSKDGNDKHNPGEPLHWSRGKSNDHADCLSRHQLDVGHIDLDTGYDHAVEVAWRAMAQLQLLAEEKYGWPIAPGAKLAPDNRKPPIPLYHDGVLVGFRADP